jgi:hypothetical protein
MPNSIDYGADICGGFNIPFENVLPEFWPCLIGKGSMGFRATCKGGPLSNCGTRSLDAMFEKAKTTPQCAEVFVNPPCQQSGCPVNTTCSPVDGVCYPSVFPDQDSDRVYGSTPEQETAWAIMIVGLALCMVGSAIGMHPTYDNNVPIVGLSFIVLGVILAVIGLILYYI